jgi:hypothetical protein
VKAHLIRQTLTLDRNQLVVLHQQMMILNKRLSLKLYLRHESPLVLTDLPLSYTAKLIMPWDVIPAKAGIQENTGFRVKPGMTNWKRPMSPCIAH